MDGTRKLVLRSAVLLITIGAAPLPAQEVGPARTFGVTFQPAPLSAAQAADGTFVVVTRGFEPPQPMGILARRFDAAGVPQGLAFRVGEPSENPRLGAVVAGDAAGDFTVVWKGAAASSSGNIVARRYAAGGIPVGAQFQVNSGTASPVLFPAVAMTAAGASVVVWESPDGSVSGIDGQAYDAAGAPVGAEFRVNTTTADIQMRPVVALNEQGGGLVAWASRGQDGDAEGIYARRVGLNGAPLGAEFRVNTFTSGIQSLPVVASLADDGFVVAWISPEGVDGAGQGVFAQRYDPAGVPLGTELRVGATPMRWVEGNLSIAPDGAGGFAVAWTGGTRDGYRGSDLVVRHYDATARPLSDALAFATFPFGLTPARSRFPALASDRAGRLVLAWELDRPFEYQEEHVVRRFGAAWPAALHVDEAPSATSDGNGVLDPGEVAVVGPAWHNSSPDAVALTGVLSQSVPDNQATYGTVPAGSTATCDPVVGCYAVGFFETGAHPHVDAGVLEQLTAVPGEDATREWAIHIGGTFDDVARSSPFYRFIETLVHFSITGGCTSSSFCPDAPVTREQMAAFLLVTKLTNQYVPPRPPVGVFTDVPATDPFAPWVEDLWSREIVEGCGPGLYCPLSPVTRAQMAVMLLRTAEGTAYVPPACTTPVFGDVPCSDPFARWINELAVRGITAGCGGGSYCPGSPVTRGQMAVFLTRAFRLDLNAPARMQDLTPLPL